MRGLIPAFLLCLSLATAAEPRRIISTAPSITEALYALGLGDRVVGVTLYCRYPADAQRKPRIGTFLEPNLEVMLSLKPDLVLVIKNPVQVAEKLRRLGVRAEELNQDSIEDILRSLGQIGQWTGTEKRAAQLTADLRAQLDQVRAAAAKRPRKPTLFLVGRSPGTLQGMVGAAGGTFVDELMTLAGADNILHNSPIPYPKVSLEQILAADPEVILDMGDFAHVEGKPLESMSKLMEIWGKYPRLRAVKNRQVRQVDSEIFIRPGPRMGQAAQALARMLQGSPAR